MVKTPSTKNPAQEMLSKWCYGNSGKSSPFDLSLNLVSISSLCVNTKGDFLRKQGFSFIFTMQVLKFPVLAYLWELK